MEGVRGIGSELERVHIAEKNKAMAAKLKVRVVTVEELVFVLYKEIGFCMCTTFFSGRSKRQTTLFQPAMKNLLPRMVILTQTHHISQLAFSMPSQLVCANCPRIVATLKE